MKQESRFVAESYRYLAPFIDTGAHLHLGLDGEAAKKGVSDSVFADPDVPDLWFTLVGSTRPTLLEAKVLHAGRRIIVNRRQLYAWRSSGLGRHKPTAWVATDEGLKTFLHWEHSDFIQQLDKSGAASKYPTFRLPDVRAEFPDVRQSALHVLRNA